MTTATTNKQQLIIPEDMPTVDLEAPISTNRAECIKEICSNMGTVLRYSTLQFWRMGRIIDMMQARGEQGVIEEIMKISKCEKRKIQYTLQVYRTIPDSAKILKLCEKGTEYSHVLQLLPLKEAERNQLMGKVLDGSLNPKDIPGIVKDFKATSKPPSSTSPSPFAFMEKYNAVFGLCDKGFGALQMDYENMMELASDDEKTTEVEFKKFTASAQGAVEAAEALIAKLSLFAKTVRAELLDDEG